VGDDTNVATCCANRREDQREGFYVIRALNGGQYGLFNNGAGPEPSSEFVAFVRYCPQCGRSLQRRQGGPRG
jgi:hypothetical protein